MHLHEQNEIVAFISEFDLSPVTAQFAKASATSSELAEALEFELKRFFELRAIFKIKYGLRGQVDDLFHAFILDTPRYHEFCDRVFGQYLHHAPADDEELDGIEHGVAYIRLLIDYFRHYGVHPPHEIWPLSGQLFGSVAEWEMPHGQCVAPCSS